MRYAFVVQSCKVKTERINKYACKLKPAYCKQISSSEYEIKLIQILCWVKLLKHPLSSHIYTASVVCLSAVISLKHFSPFCVHLQTEQQSIAFTSGDWDSSSPDLYFARLRRCVELQCTNKSSQYYWSFSEENSPPIICYRTTYTIQHRAWQMERWVEMITLNCTPERIWCLKKPWRL